MSVENVEASTLPLADEGRNADNLVPSQMPDREELPGHNISEEVRIIIEMISATGKYCYDWNILKIIVAFRLRQVLAEYPEPEITSDGGPYRGPVVVEKHSEVVERLVEALFSFTEGPPFTLQRLCEILSTPKSMYSNLSKLVLALEKNLLVTSTLPICVDPCPPWSPAAIEKLVEDLKALPPDQTNCKNENPVDDADVEMVDQEDYPENKTSDDKEEKLEDILPFPKNVVSPREVSGENFEWVQVHWNFLYGLQHNRKLIFLVRSY